MSFVHIRKNGIEFLQSNVMSASVHHAFSTRIGGVSKPPWDTLNLGVGRGDNLEDVRENYLRFCSVTEMNASRCVLSKQLHEDHVRIVTQDDIGKGLWRDRDYTSVDSMICNIPDIPLVVFSADCNILLYHDPIHHAVGATHAGWRGTVLGIAKKTALEMNRVYGSRPEDLEVAIGPSIGYCCFETDEDVPIALHEVLGEASSPYMKKNGEKWHINLKGINAYWLQSVGIKKIDICNECTACHPELYWSHRKLGNNRGAQIAMISL